MSPDPERLKAELGAEPARHAGLEFGGRAAGAPKARQPSPKHLQADPACSRPRAGCAAEKSKAAEHRSWYIAHRNDPGIRRPKWAS